MDIDSFYQQVDNSAAEQEVIAFAMLLYACSQTNAVAQDVSVRSTCVSAYIEPCLNLNPHRFSDLINQPLIIIAALDYLTRLLAGKNIDHNLKQSVIYTHSILKLRKIVLRNSDKLQLLENRLQIISRYKQIQPEQIRSDDPQLVHKLAALYLDVFGSLNFRIIVQGKPETLRDQIKIDQIRCLLLGAVRFSVLWHQVGGRQWKLIVKRRKIHDIAKHLSTQLFDIQHTSRNIVKFKP